MTPQQAQAPYQSLSQAQAPSQAPSQSQNPQDLEGLLGEACAESSADSIIFGPVYSRRFGRSLGIDLSPAKKQCNFDCVYCELHKAAPMDSQAQAIAPQLIIAAIESALKRYGKKGRGENSLIKNPSIKGSPIKDAPIDVLTFTATGEPTLYPHLHEVIAHIAPLLREYYPHIRSLILSNGSLLLAQKPALLLFDMVKFSIDAAIPLAFKRVDRPSASLDLPSMLEGIKEFARAYQASGGELIAEILLVRGHNDSAENLRAIASFLREIPNLARVDLGTIDRPSAYPVQALSQKELAECARYFDDLPLSLPARENLAPDSSPLESNVPESSAKSPIDSTKAAKHTATLLKLLATRPIACDEAGSICESICGSGDLGLAILRDLLAQGHITIKSQGAHQFYTIARDPKHRS